MRLYECLMANAAILETAASQASDWKTTDQGTVYSLQKKSSFKENAILRWAAVVLLLFSCKNQ